MAAFAVTHPSGSRAVDQDTKVKPPLMSVAGGTYAENRPYLLPETLGELAGPLTGVVLLPPRLDWSERTEFRLDDPAERNVMYERVIREASAASRRARSRLAMEPPHERIARIAVIAALEAAGYKASVIMSAETFTRLILTDTADGSEKRSSFRSTGALTSPFSSTSGLSCMPTTLSPTRSAPCSAELCHVTSWTWTPLLRAAGTRASNCWNSPPSGPRLRPAAVRRRARSTNPDHRHRVRVVGGGVSTLPPIGSRTNRASCTRRLTLVGPTLATMQK